MKKSLFLIVVFLTLQVMPAGAEIEVLHSFTGNPDGAQPEGSLCLSGSTLYGMTTAGGFWGAGTVFKLQTNGTGYTRLHTFTGDDDGARPLGSLVISGSALYGTTYFGWYGSGRGAVFKINADGTGRTPLHEFSDGTDGGWPEGSLILSGSTLYGMSRGWMSNGTVFKINTDGTGYAVLHVFAGGDDDGEDPYGNLVLSGSTLYGMTWMGGDEMQGTVFKINTDGSGFTLLHEFGWEDGGGRLPEGSLVLSGSTLYGTTCFGPGSSGGGAIFKIGTDGSGYEALHVFAGGSEDGSYPKGSLILSGSTLYGTTSEGGDSDLGTVFTIQTDGSGYSLLHEFTGGATDGSHPYESLVLGPSALYGMTTAGGGSDLGTVFSLHLANAGQDDFVATWDGQGVYYRNSVTAAWVKLASPATLIAAGGLDDDAIDDIIGIWPGQGGVWVKFSATGTWAKLSSTAKHIATGDMNGDGRVELLGTWDGQGVYWRNNASGAWTKLASPATLITAGDIDHDGTDDLIGIWPSQGGVWVKYSQSGSWERLSTTATDIAAGDMNGDGRDDLLATWDGQGVYYRDSAGGAWVKLATPATQVTAGDLDGDGSDDVIGIWPSQAGVWVKYSQAGTWTKLSSTAVDIAAGVMCAAGATSFPGAAMASGAAIEDDFGPIDGADALDLSGNAPGGMNFHFAGGENLDPSGSEDDLGAPGPGEPGFHCLEQNHMVPGSVIADKRAPVGRKQRR